MRRTTKSIIPEDWEQKSFSECVEKTSIPRQIKIPQGQYQKAGEYPIVDQGADFIAGYTDDKSRLYSGQLPVIVFGDHTRIFKYVDFAFSLGADGTKLLCPKKYLNPHYFYYYLCGLSLESKGYNRHYKYLKEELISFPGMLEQRKISHILLNIKNVIDHQEQIIAKTKELKRSLMHQLFTHGLRSEELKETEIGAVPNSWNKKDLEQVADIVYGAQAAVAHALDSSIGTPIFTNINITNEGKIDLTTLRYYKVPEKKRNRLMLKKGDILFNWRSGSKGHVGKTALFELDGEYTFSSFILRFRTSKDMHNRFLVYYLQYLKSIGYFSQYRDQSSVNSVFNASASAKIPVFMPEMDEQEEIALAINSIDLKIGAEKSRSNSIKALFRTILNNLMIGQARVKDIDFCEINV